MMLEVGQLLAHFKVIRKLGEGGMGEVYLAEDTKLNRQVALKILQAEFLDNDDRRARFEREAKTAAQITHANVMAIYDTDVAVIESTGQKLTYIVMEYVAGRCLTEYLGQRHPNVGEMLRLAQRIAAGLAAAHKLHIVHRDIKGENILITDQGEPKILDFGLAKPIDAVFSSGGEPGSTNTISQELTQEGKILGTITYMSPEQARGEAVDARSDVFSFGILVYKMFAGKSPFEARDRVSTLAKILEGKHTPLRQINAAAPAELERILDKCLQKDPNDRYQDTRDLVVDLRSLRKQYDSGISDSTSITAEMQAAPPARRSLWRRPVFWISLAAAALLIPIVVFTIIVVSWSDQANITIDPGENPDEFARNLTNQISRTLADAGIQINNAALQIPGVAAMTDALAILGFENKTNDPELDWLSAGLPEILLTDLTQGSTVNIISRTRVLDCLGGNPFSGQTEPTHEACMKAARSLGASTVLSGSYFKMGDKIRIDARLEDTKSGRIILAEKVVGDDPFVLVDSLTAKIAESLHLTESERVGTEVASITSSSPEAYKHYILGMEEFAVNNTDEAVEHFERAIAIDSTFALPYMRIGMGHALNGRAKEGSEYIEKAKRLEQKLPVRERALLDIYADIWLYTQYDEALTKIQTFVQTYPDDKEARTFLAILLHVLARDSESALAQLDTVMMLDPKYGWAFTFYHQIYSAQGDLEKATEINQRAKRYHPKTVLPYMNIASIYLEQGLDEKAARECEAVLEFDPGHAGALTSLGVIAMRQRDFEKAREILLKVKEHHGDDNFQMVNIEHQFANLDFWEGRFYSAMEHLHASVDYGLLTGDSIQISNCYQIITGRYYLLNMPDSTLHYSELAYKYASDLQALGGHPVTMVQVDRNLQTEARKIFARAFDNFKSRVPQQMWSLGETIQQIFESFCAADTAGAIEALGDILSDQPQSGGDRFIYGRLLVDYGKFEEGRDELKKLLSGELETTNGMRYFMATYYVGIAEESLGNLSEAKKRYQEMLKYWDKADIQLDEIVDARERLARLTS
ncbi:MAG: protein kinase [bacterium]